MNTRTAGACPCRGSTIIEPFVLDRRPTEEVKKSNPFSVEPNARPLLWIAPDRRQHGLKHFVVEFFAARGYE